MAVTRTQFLNILVIGVTSLSIIAAIVYWVFLLPSDVERPPVVPVRESKAGTLVVLDPADDRPVSDSLDDLWNSERLVESLDKPLSLIKACLRHQGRDEDVKAILCETVHSNLHSVARTRPVYRDAMLEIVRADDQAPKPVTQGETIRQLRNLNSEFRSPSDAQISLKIVRLRIHDQGFETHILYEASQLGDAEGIQQTATWVCDWLVPKASQSAARLSRISLEDFEKAKLNSAKGRLFVDATASAFRNVKAYDRQVKPGVPSWLKRLPRELVSQFGHHGMAIGDVNGDQLDDLYVCDAGGLPNRLYIQSADGSLVDQSAKSGVNFLDDSVGALLIDLDNDGDQDLVVGTDPYLQIADNDGQGHFRRRSTLDLQTDSFSLSAADFDRDGDLDLYVCGYDMRRRATADRGLPFPMPYHDANNGAPNRLLRNDGDFRFTDVTAEVGLDGNNRRFSMAASWEDVDNDGDQDLYVANDFGRNNLYRNDEGQFKDIAESAEVVDHGSGMSVSWGDYDRDGNVDLYIGNMFSAAGNRVSFQDRFTQGVPESTSQHLQRMARGNTLYRNRSVAAQAKFDDASREAGVLMGRWAWASRFADLQNDGWPDIVVTNGYLTNQKTDDL